MKDGKCSTCAGPKRGICAAKYHQRMDMGCGGWIPDTDKSPMPTEDPTQTFFVVSMDRMLLARLTEYAAATGVEASHIVESLTRSYLDKVRSGK